MLDLDMRLSHRNTQSFSVALARLILGGTTMSKNAALMLTLTLLGIAPAHAINAKFAQQLERSGCTQVTEAQRL